VGAQLLSPGKAALGEHAHRLARAKRLDDVLEGGGVACATPDRDLAHAVEDRPQARNAPEARPSEEAQPPVGPDGQAHQDGIPLAVVVGHDQERSTLGHRRKPIRAQAPPPGDGPHERGDQVVEH
jgi:hypothetical protein